MNMRKWALTTIMACLLLNGCSDGDSADENNTILLTPDAPVTINENNGSTSFSVFLNEPSDAVLQVQVTISEPSRVRTTLPGNLLTVMPGNAIQSIAVQCIDNSQPDGDHTVTLTFTTIASDEDLSHLSFTRQIICQDDDPQTQPIICTDAQVQCVDNTQYQTCINNTWSQPTPCPADKPVCSQNQCTEAQIPDPPAPTVCQPREIQCYNDHQYLECDDGQWSQMLTDCPTETPVCNPQTNTCETETVVPPPIPECQPKCAGDQIQKCNSDGTLAAAADCNPGYACRTTDGIAECTQIPTSNTLFTVTPSKLDIYEGGSATFTIVPTIKPNSTVNVTLSLSDSKEAQLAESAYTFKTSNWSAPQTVTVTGLRDNQADGDKNIQVTFKVSSSDERFHGSEIPASQLTIIDTEADASIYNGDTSLRFRAMAANITSGNYSAYSPGEGVRMFKALKPDIVMIQEFNWYNKDDSDAAAMNLIQQAFDSSFYVHRGHGSIPNGIISRYPIIDSGYWESNKIHDRDWDWALIDLPGKKELLVLSVHLSTSDNKQEAPSLMTKLNQKITNDKNKNLNYYLMIGGDFNSNFKGNGSLKNYFQVNVELPVDQDDDSTTNAKRKSTLDHLFVDKEFNQFEVPVQIGKHSYPNGHVFDSRVYNKHGELGDVSPVKATDSKATNMQHMPVIRDFEFTLQ